MRFATKQDIEAPIADVFRIISDFEAWERAAMHRGAEVSRTDKLRVVAAGMRWAARFSYRSKPRNMELELTQIEALHQRAGLIERDFGVNRHKSKTQQAESVVAQVQ